jgi:hypothetical protein
MRGQFKYLNLNTEFAVSGAYTKEMDLRPCFRLAFEFNRSKARSKHENVYKIKVYTNNSANRRNRNNYCIINDIGKYLTYLQEVVDFDFSIEKVDKDYSFMNIIVNDLGLIHNYVLCVVRYCYEFPYNLALSDAIQLYESNSCPGLNIIDCFNLVLAQTKVYYHGEQCCMWYKGDTKPMCKKEIRNVILASGRNNSTCIKLSTYPQNGNNQGYLSYIEDDHVENWINSFHKRINHYIKVYNRIKCYV